MRESAVWGGGIKRHLNAELKKKKQKERKGGRDTRKEKTVKELHTKEKEAEGRGGWERQE